MVKKISEPHCLCCQEVFRSFFSKLSPEDLRIVQLQKVVQQYKKGSKIFFEGNKPHGVFCVKSGHIKIFKHSSHGLEHIIRLAFPGEFIGLKALLTGTTYSVSAQALEDSVLCFIGKTEFFQLTLRYPEFTSALIVYLNKQLVDAEEKMISLARKPVKERLANTLLYLYQNFLIPSVPPEYAYLNLARHDLANFVGAAPETVIRLLAEWKEKKIISVKGRKIFIQDEARLKKIACIY
ncbi:MAG: Crp/Fnr family transcriptional regulator [Bacteroidia bacterium]|nr:Crp/Fnr family transcriptional regulator [Bacteroidia bacterium]